MNERFASTSVAARVNLARESEFSLGSLSVRPALCQVEGSGGLEQLEPRVMQVLVALSRANGNVVSRDDLIEACWEGRVVGEDSITRCIVRLRKLADANQAAFTLETVLRVGWRLKIAAASSRGAAQNRTRSIAVEGEPLRAAKPSRFGVGTASVLGIFFVFALLIGATLIIRQVWIPRRTAPVPPEESLAVLPFVNMSGNTANDYFSDGFSEELRSELANDPRLRVVARVSSFAFKGINADIKTIARKLGVRSVVEGTVREAGNRVRITAELVDAADGFRIWSGTYDRDLSDILNVQSNVARAVAGALTHRLIPALSARRPKIDPVVYRQYLEAKWQLRIYTLDTARKAYAQLMDVTERQPNFADGFAALARVEGVLSELDLTHSSPYSAMAGESAARALQLDPQNVDAHSEHEGYELGVWNWQAAAIDFRALRNANRDNWDTLRGFRFYYMTMGFPTEAVAAIRRATSENLTPYKFPLIYALETAGSYRELIQAARNIGARDANRSDDLDELCEAYAMTRQVAAAREIKERLDRSDVTLINSWDRSNCTFYFDLVHGDARAAREIVRGFELKYQDGFPATWIAQYYVLLNDFDKAGDWYGRAYARREIELLQATFWPPTERYRGTTRWKALMQQPALREWQAEHDRVAAALVRSSDPLN
jgi:TolB-like protein/DNA-binding winged helix-turn-helix (wHTH) protein/tetratricopeptide (TPR) repeat protein